MEIKKNITKLYSDKVTNKVTKLTSDELKALIHVEIPSGRKVSKTWEAMVKYKGQSIVNDPSLLV